MKRIQRSISFLLALVMVFSMLPPMEVHAEEPDPTSETEAVMTVEETTVPTEAVTEPAEEITVPTEVVTEPTEETTAPTEPVTESTHEEVAPKEETVEEETDAITVESVIISQAESNAVLAAGTAQQQEETVAVTFIEITAETDCIAPGETMQLTATVLPENAADKTVTWSSQDESVLTVDENGLVTGVAGGCTFVDAASSDGNVAAQYEIAVFDETVIIDEGAVWSSSEGTEYTNLKQMFQTVGRPGHYVFMSGKGNMVQHAVMLMGVEKDHIKVLEYGGIDGYKVRKESEYPYSYLMNYGEISICEANNFDNFTESEILKKINEIYLIFEAWSDETYPIFTANKRACVHPKDENGKDTYACSNCDVVNVVAALKNAGIVDFSYSSHAYTCVGFCHFATRYIYEKTIFGGNQSIIAFANTATSISGSGDIEDDNIDPTPDLTPEQYLSRYKKSMTEISKIAIPEDGNSADSWKLPWTNADENGKQDETLKQGVVTGRIKLIREIVNHMGNTWYEYETGTSTRGFVYSGDIYILPEHTITLDPNGGSCDVKEIVLVDGQHKLDLPTPIRAGYTFDGWWYEDETGSYEMISGNTYTIGMSGTLRAHWIQNPVAEPYYDHDQVKISNITEDNALITAVCYNPEGITLKHGGFQIREKGSTDITTKTDDIAGSYQTKDKLNCSYDLKNDYDIILEPGTTYEYRLYVQDSAGNIYYCCDDQWHTFTTTGTAPSEPDTSVDPPETISAAAYLADYAERVRIVKAVAVPADGDPITTWKLPWTNNSSNNLRLGTVSGRINLTREVINHVGNTWYEYDTGSTTRGFIPASDVRILLKRTITLDANGGSCSTKEIILVEGEQKLNLPTPTRSDYIFDGWFTEKTGGTQYISGNTYTISADITLYAHWTVASAVDPDVSINAADYLAQYAKKVTSINKTAVTAGSDPITTWKLPWTNTKNGVQDTSLKLGTVSGGITLIREVVNHAGNLWYEYETGSGTRGFVYHADITFETVKPYCTVKPHSEPTEDNTVLYATWNNPSGITLTHGGFRLGTNPNNLTQYRENVASGWETAESIPCSYDLKNDYDVNLQPGTTYYYQFFIEASDEAVYSSEMNSFTTAGKAYIVIDEAEYWITEDMVLTENILIAEGSSVYIDEGVTVTVPSGIELNIQGYVEVYGNLIFEDGGILTITDEYLRRLSVWTGRLDATKADITGVPYGAVEIQLNSTAEIKGIPDEMLYATTYVYSTEDINNALGNSSKYYYFDLASDSSFTLTNSITIPENTEWYLWKWYSDDWENPTVTIPSGVTVTNNGWLTVQENCRMVFEPGSKLINNGEAYADRFGAMLIHGTLENTGTIEESIFAETVSQDYLEGCLADAKAYGRDWIHECATTLSSDMTIDLGSGKFHMSRYGSLIVPDGVTLTLNSSVNTDFLDYDEWEAGSIIVKNGGKLVINGYLDTHKAENEVILEDGSYLKVNGCMVSNGTISIGKNTVIEMTGRWIGYAPRNNGGAILPSVTNISITTENSFVDPDTEEYVKLFISIDGASWLQSKNGVILGAIWTSSDNEIIDPSRIKECGMGEYWAYLGDKTGMVTLTATSIDGSGKTASITLKVGTDVENRVNVPAAELNGQTSLWIDGKEYALQTDGDNCYVDLPDSNAKTMIAYTYHVDDASDIHTQYPVSMKVWTLSNEDGLYTATRAEELDDILQYSGSSIRVTGKQGIRMITSIEKDKKDALVSDGLAGYTLKEYGTVVAWTSQMGNKPLVLGKVYAKSNYAYKKGIADPVFSYDGDLMQYTNVLVGFSTAQCKNDLAMRPYMILEDAEGNEIILYGGIVTRSIGYIALQNRDTFAEGTEAYNYVWNIIRSVYGDAYNEVNAA